MSERGSSHPDHEALRRFSRGKSSAWETSMIEQHLNQCDQCSTELDRVSLEADPFVGQLKRMHQAHDPDKTSTYQDNVSGLAPGNVTAALPRHVGEYELLAEIARGGMGVVYKARHRKLGRLAAVKMILGARFISQEQVQRFYAEAEAAAQLDHPGIVPVFEVGEYDGQHYLAMAFVEGQSLWQQVTEQPLEPRAAARVMQRTADAVQYAHEHGIVHRDLKPQNILRTADGHPRVTDFGLAKRQAGDSGLTQTGQILGTPSYMPPEQAAGKMDQVGPLSDVYSLGATLYCLLTGRPPFQAASPVETLKQVLEQEPVSPRALNSAVHRELESICLKALRKSPKLRYASAREFSDDLERFLIGQPVLAQPAGIVREFWGWVLRHRNLATSLTVGVSVAMLTAGILMWTPGVRGQLAGMGVAIGTLGAVFAFVVLFFWIIVNAEDGSQATRRLESAYEDVEQTVIQLSDQLTGSPPIQMRILSDFRRFFERSAKREGLPEAVYVQLKYAAERLERLLSIVSQSSGASLLPASAANPLPVPGKAAIDSTSIVSELRPRHWTKRRFIILGVSSFFIVPGCFVLGAVLTGGKREEQLGASLSMLGILGLPLLIAIAAVSPPIWYLRRRLNHADPRVRIGAVLVLERLGPKARGAVNALSKRLDDPSREVRVAAVRALAAIGSDRPAAMSSLNRAAADTDLIVAAEGLRGVQQIDFNQQVEQQKASWARDIGMLLSIFVRPASESRWAVGRRLALAFIRGAAIWVIPAATLILIGGHLGEILRPIPQASLAIAVVLAGIMGGIIQIVRLLQPSRKEVRLFGLSQRNTQILGGLLMTGFALLFNFEAQRNPQLEAVRDPRMGMFLALGIAALLDVWLPNVRLSKKPPE